MFLAMNWQTNSANFFSDKIKLIHSNFSVDNQSIPSDIPSVVKSLSVLAPASTEEVRKLILASPTKSCSSDPIPTFLLKDCIEQLLPAITAIINASLSSATVPCEFKKALVTPILKKASLVRDKLSNYRQVSNLSFLSKLLEKVMSKCLHAHKNLSSFHGAITVSLLSWTFSRHSCNMCYE